MIWDVLWPKRSADWRRYGREIESKYMPWRSYDGNAFLEGGDAWDSYLKLCGMGGMYGYLETLRRAGLPNRLLPKTVKEIAAFVEQHAWKLKEKM